jgi:hypothetical protein
MYLWNTQEEGREEKAGKVGNFQVSWKNNLYISDYHI